MGPWRLRTVPHIDSNKYATGVHAILPQLLDNLSQKTVMKDADGSLLSNDITEDFALTILSSNDLNF